MYSMRMTLLNRWNEFDYFQYDLISLEIAYDFAIWQKVKCSI